MLRIWPGGRGISARSAAPLVGRWFALARRELHRGAPQSASRDDHDNSSSASEEAAYSAEPGGAHHRYQQQSSYDQFMSEQQRYRRSSLHAKGSATSQRERSTSESFTEGQRVHPRGSNHRADHNKYGSGSSTAQARRHVTQRWENAFFGKVHFEEGMHDRFAAAMAAEDAEEQARYLGKTNAELFPQWAEDEPAPPHAFRRLPPALQRRYIINRLAMGERRVRYAVDYGSLSMMYQLNLGEMMLREAEALLTQMGWMSPALEERIAEVKAEVEKIKYDFDLD